MSSIRGRLARNVLATVLSLLTVGLGMLFIVAYDGATNIFDDMLEARAESLAAVTVRVEGRVTVDLSESMLRSFGEDNNGDHLYFQVWDETGRTVVRSPTLDDDERLPRRTGDLDDAETWNLTLPNGRPGRALGIQFKPAGDQGGRDSDDVVHLVVASDREDLEEALFNMVVTALALGAVLIVATLIVVPRVLRNGLSSLDVLVRRAAGIDALSLNQRFATEGLPSELQPIVARLNELLGRLEESFDRERRFSADLAHELRTPLAELRSIAETALRWPEQRDPLTDKDVLAIALQMERMAEYLLALARSEKGTLATKSDTVEVASFVREIYAQKAARASERRLRTSLRLEEVTAQADRTLLGAIFTNLIENAVEYAPEGGELVITAVKHLDHVMISVANHAPQLEGTDILRMFDRFWRKDSARSGGKNAGLGVPLARSFATLMGWDLSAQIDEARVLHMTLRSPASRDPKPAHL